MTRLQTWLALVEAESAVSGFDSTSFDKGHRRAVPIANRIAIGTARAQTMSRVNSQVMVVTEIKYWHVKLLLEWYSRRAMLPGGKVVKFFALYGMIYR